MPSSPICLSEVAKQAPRLFASIPLIQRKENVILVKKKRLPVVVFFYLCT